MNVSFEKGKKKKERYSCSGFIPSFHSPLFFLCVRKREGTESTECSVCSTASLIRVCLNVCMCAFEGVLKLQCNLIFEQWRSLIRRRQQRPRCVRSHSFYFSSLFFFLSLLFLFRSNKLSRSMHRRMYICCFSFFCLRRMHNNKTWQTFNIYIYIYIYMYICKVKKKKHN